MSYTWEDVQLGIDVKAEQKRKEEEAKVTALENY